ncbi:TonB family protein [Pseudomonas lactucae]|uniref:TonB family protein n=1 Tax=Pseudomonas lactucae TaxID=2813360 RepID=UPI002FCD4FE8
MSRVWHTEKNRYSMFRSFAGVIIAIAFHVFLFYFFLMNHEKKTDVKLLLSPKAAPIVVELAPQIESLNVVSTVNSSTSKSSPSTDPRTAGIEHHVVSKIPDAQVKVASGQQVKQKAIPKPKRIESKSSDKSEKKNKTIKRNKDDVEQATQVQKNSLTTVSEANKAPEEGAESTSSASALRNWNSIVLSKLQAEKKYPPFALRSHMEDTVLVSFRVDQAGVASEARVIDSYGYTLLDEESLSLVSRVSPLPKPPKSALVNGYANVIVPIIFTIR